MYNCKCIFNLLVEEKKTDTSTHTHVSKQAGWKNVQKRKRERERETVRNDGDFMLDCFSTSNAIVG